MRKHAAILLVVALGFAALTTGCTRCPDEEIDAIYASIPEPATKHQAGDDLKGWTYAHITSEASKQTYYYYHMPSKKPDAPVFVLVHGMFLDGRTYLNFGPLAEDFELVALELPYSSPFYKGQVGDFPRLLQDFLDTMKLTRIYLGGVSLGGQIAMFYMVQDPKTEVDGLALISTDMVKNEEELDKAKKNIERLLGLTDDDDRKMLCVLSKVVNWKKKRAGESSKEVLDLFTYKKPSFYRQVMYTGLNMKAPPKLEKIKVPTLIILGDADSTIEFDDAKPLVNHIPGAELKVIKDGEHDMAFTRADEVVPLLKEKFVPR